MLANAAGIAFSARSRVACTTQVRLSLRWHLRVLTTRCASYCAGLPSARSEPQEDTPPVACDNERHCGVLVWFDPATSYTTVSPRSLLHETVYNCQYKEVQDLEFSGSEFTVRNRSFLGMSLLKQSRHTNSWALFLTSVCNLENTASNCAFA